MYHMSAIFWQLHLNACQVLGKKKKKQTFQFVANLRSVFNSDFKILLINTQKYYILYPKNLLIVY